MATNESNAPGASAQREYDRRKTNDEQKIRDKWGQGKLGSLAVALTDEKQSTAAWKSGARGEARVGSALDAIASETITVLHDRRIPRSRANIDHIVVTSAGVWVIDAKRYQNKRPQLRAEGGLFRPRVEKLIVGGDKTSLIEGVLKQKTLVENVVGHVPVSAALCFVDADWPMFGGDFVVRGVEVCWPKRLVKTLQESAGIIDAISAAAAISAHFPPA